MFFVQVMVHEERLPFVAPVPVEKAGHGATVVSVMASPLGMTRGPGLCVGFYYVPSLFLDWRSPS